MVFRFKSSIITLFLFFVCSSFCAKPRLLQQVVSERRHMAYGKSFVLHSQQGFVLINPEAYGQSHTITDTHLTVRVEAEGMYLNNKWCLATELFITPVRGAFVLYGVRHYGTLHIKLDAHGMQLTSCATVQACNTMYASDWLPSNSEQSVLVQPLVYQKKKTKRTARKKPAGEHEKTLEQFATLTAESTIAPGTERVSLVRVLLDSWPQTEKRTITLASAKGFTVVRKVGARFERTQLKDKTITVGRVHNKWVVGGKQYATDKLTFIPQEGTVSFDGKEYAGAVQVVKDGAKIRLINCLDIESYLFCVLRTEGWPGWPLEVYKALAVACRTYVIAMAREAKATGRLYHVQNSNIHQTYAGWHGITRLKDAVDQTRGMFLAYNNRPIVAMYDSCCGGVVPAHLDGVDFKKAPYLARKYPCTYCKSCSIYQWRAEYSLDDLHDIVREHIPEFKQLRRCSIAGKDKAGTVQELALDDGDCRWIVSGKKAYSMFSDVKSFHFSVKKKADKVLFEGRGFGHHLGLCQWGAREMVRAGWDYQRLLQFYYPGTTFMKLS